MIYITGTLLISNTNILTRLKNNVSIALQPSERVANDVHITSFASYERVMKFNLGPVSTDVFRNKRRILE